MVVQQGGDLLSSRQLLEDLGGQDRLWQGWFVFQPGACSVRDGCRAGQLTAKCAPLASLRMVVLQLARNDILCRVCLQEAGRWHQAVSSQGVTETIS